MRKTMLTLSTIVLTGMLATAARRRLRPRRLARRSRGASSPQRLTKIRRATWRCKCSCTCRTGKATASIHIMAISGRWWSRARLHSRSKARRRVCSNLANSSTSRAAPSIATRTRAAHPRAPSNSSSRTRANRRIIQIRRRSGTLQPHGPEFLACGGSREHGEQCARSLAVGLSAAMPPT